MEWIIMVLAVLAIGAMVLNSIVVVPTAHYGIVVRFNKRTGRVLREGLHWIWPLIEEVEGFDGRLQSTSIPLSFFSKDNSEVILKFTVQWLPDFEVRYQTGPRENWSTFLDNTPETILAGISDIIRSIVGNIIGKVDADVFIGHKKAVGRYIDCVLRLKKPLHAEPFKATGVESDEFDIKFFAPKVDASGKEIEGEVDELKKKFSAKKEIEDIMVRLLFYEQYSSEINELLRKEREDKNEHSEIENRYGIDIRVSELSDVDFSEKTKAALELRRQTKEKLKADELEWKKTLEITMAAIGAGLNPQEAFNTAAVILDQAKKDIKSIEGLDKLKDVVKIVLSK